MRTHTRTHTRARAHTRFARARTHTHTHTHKHTIRRVYVHRLYMYSYQANIRQQILYALYQQQQTNCNVHVCSIFTKLNKFKK